MIEEEEKRTFNKRVLVLLALAPLTIVAEYFVILIFTLPYSHLVNENNILFLTLVGSALTLISLYWNLIRRR